MAAVVPTTPSPESQGSGACVAPQDSHHLAKHDGALGVVYRSALLPPTASQGHPAPLGAAEGCTAVPGCPSDDERAGLPPFLDQGGRNVPRESAQEPPTERKSRGWVPWTKKHFRTRAALRECLSVWQAAGFKVYFLTFTSSAASSQHGDGRTALLEHWQALRKRLARHLEVEPRDVMYRGVRTSEGFGVLHLLVAVDQKRVGNAWRLVDFEHLQDWWRELHGAWHVNVKRLRMEGRTAARVSRYVVSQYMVRQGGEYVDALVRTFGSRLDLQLPRLRRDYRAIVSWRRWEQLGLASRACAADEAAMKAVRRRLWDEMRAGWHHLLERGSVSLWGASVVLLPWCGGVIEEA